MELYPLAITAGDLATLSRVCGDVLGYSPTRGLDAMYLKADDPAAFLSVLTMDNKPLAALRHATHILRHYFASFLVVADFDILTELQNLTPLRIYSKPAHRDCVAVISGSLDEWVAAIEAGVLGSKDVKQLMLGVIAHFCRSGLREVFGKLRKKYGQ